MVYDVWSRRSHDLTAGKAPHVMKRMSACFSLQSWPTPSDHASLVLCDFSVAHTSQILRSCLFLLGVEVLRWPCLSVCLSMFVRKHISGIERPIFTKFLCMLPMADGSVVLWRRCDTLCASGFVDGVMFVYNASRPRNSDWIRSSMDLSPWHIIQTDPPAGSTDRGGVWNLRLPCLYTLASLIDLLSI